MISESTLAATRIVFPEPASSGLPAALFLSAEVEAGRAGSVGPSVIVDFGREVFGGIRLEVLGVEEDESRRIRIRLGESVSEAIAGTYVDLKERVGAGSKVDAGVTGFRFARVDIVDLSSRVEITLPEAYCLARDVARLGSFSCDDPRLERAWEVGARTAHLCMQEHIWDGIKRGRTVWAGDIHPAWNVIAAAFGPHPIVTASLDQIRDRTTDNRGEVAGWMNGIPAYSLWWVICQAEWHLYTGDKAYLAQQAKYLKGLMASICVAIDDDGHEEFEGWRYLDWATTRDFAAVDVGYHGLTTWALRSALVMFETLGDTEMHARCGEALGRVKSYRPPATLNKQARALLVLGGLEDAATTNREVLAADPVAGLTPFLGYHVLEARALAGDHAAAHDLIRSYWGAMIDLGATTYWEDFDIAWVPGSGPIDEVVPEGLRDIHEGLGRNTERGMGLSLCHAWSAGPTAWLTRYVLGIQPVEPGCRVVRITPQLGELSRAEGSYPTPLGVIRVRHRQRLDGTVETEVEAPEGVEVVVGS